MALPVFDAVSTATDVAFSGTVTWAHTVGAGANAYLFVCASPSFSNSPVPTGVTYNGVAMLAMPSSPTTGDSQPDQLWAFYLKAPATGTHNIVVTMNPQTQYLAAVGVSVTGVDPTSPFGTAAQAAHDAAGAGSGSATLPIAGATGDLTLVFASHNFFDNTFALQAGTTMTAAGGVTQRAQVTNPQSVTDGQSMRMSVGDLPSAATVNPAWTLSKDVYWIAYGISLKAVAGAATVSTAGVLLQPVPHRPAPGGLGGFEAPEMQTWGSTTFAQSPAAVASLGGVMPQMAIPMRPTAGGFVLGSPVTRSQANPVPPQVVASMTPPALVMGIPMRRGPTGFIVGTPTRADTSTPLPAAITVAGTVPFPVNTIPMHRGPGGLYTRGTPVQGAASKPPTPPVPPVKPGGGILNRRRRR